MLQIRQSAAAMRSTPAPTHAPDSNLLSCHFPAQQKYYVIEGFHQHSDLPPCAGETGKLLVGRTHHGLQQCTATGRLQWR